MDRLLELFKELEFEKNLKEQIDRIKDLAEEQKSWLKNRKKGRIARRIKEKQEDIIRSLTKSNKNRLS